MDEPIIKKRVDESWKEQAEKEKQAAPPGGTAQQHAERPAEQGGPSEPPGEAEPLQARFDLFLSGLAMEALIALGDLPHPMTKRQSANLPQARYLVDLIGMLEEKTKGNLTADEERLLKDTLYQLRMRYLAKSGA